MIESATLASSDGVEQLAILIEDFDLQIAKDVAALLVVGDGCVTRTADADEGLVTLCPTGVSIEVLHCRPAFDEGRFFRHDVRSQCTQRRDVVDDPDAASM